MKCRICGSEELSLFYKQGSNDQFEFYKCGNCKLVNLDLENISITDNQQKYTTDYQPPKNYNLEKKALKTFRFANKYVPVKGDFMDIGCGFGSVLYFFKNNGWNVRGLELSNELASHVKQTLDIPVDVSDFLVYDSKQQFDLVSLRHVLEHIPDSNLALNKISGLLKPHGYILFEFPNISGLTHKILRLRNRIRWLKKEYKSSYVPGHCNEFSRSSFEYLLKKNSFKIIRWETYSAKPLSNFIYNHIHSGSKARVIVQKVD